MAQINEAWRVLSDPARRAVYDAQSRGHSNQRSAGSAAGSSNGSSNGGGVRTATASASAASSAPHRFAPPGSLLPPRFPWRLMLGIVVLGVVAVLLNAALTSPGEEPRPDNLMEVGSCVDILENEDAKEVLCSGPYDGVVADLRPVESICAFGTELHRDRQGMGPICVRITTG